ncbi:hypothetical protein LCGC14_1709400 [marine sediment metagenome]|uniref:Uncharacterized protein n=1 Tax=marine sediment metagenome TaxID=412755 RepID=A0A0F9HF88_9ZZZZ
MNEPTPAPREPSVEDAARACPRCGDYSCGCFDEHPARAEPQRTPEPLIGPEEYYYELPEDAEYRQRLERKMQEEK